MKKISLQKLYILSSIKSSLINLAVLAILISIGISIYNKKQLNELVLKVSLSKNDLKQIEQFNLAGNHDAIDLFFMDKKSEHGFLSIELTNSSANNEKSCFSVQKITACTIDRLIIYQELPLTKDQFVKFALLRPPSTSGRDYYFIAFIIFFFNLLTSYLANHFSQKEIRRQLKEIERNSSEKDGTRIVEFEKINEIINDGIQAKLKLNIAKSNIQIIKKLQHDIDSPLTSLQFFFSSAKSFLGEELRNVGQQSIERIQDIINTLKINEQNSILNESSDKEIVAIFPILKRIISEKRIEFRYYKDVKIRLENQDTKDHFVYLKKSDFSRAISNIINNSVESKKDNSEINITIKMLYTANEILIHIQDNGIGIPKKYLNSVFEYGKSFGKLKGTGIGLFQAKEYIESEKGRITIDSQEGSGTIITISLQKSPAPIWYADQITLGKNKVVIIDDDESIHVLWKRKFSHFNVQIKTFRSSFEFRNWALKYDLKDYFFLFDLELIGSPHTGLDLIKEFSLQDSSILVTSHFMNKDISMACQQEKIKMIPKESAIHIQVQLKSLSEYQPESVTTNNTSIKEDSLNALILIDDDDLVHVTWKMIADKKNKNLFSFYNIEAFLRDSNQFNSKIEIYIDSNLGDKLKGEIAAKEIYDMGFKNLFITSGETLATLPPWIKGQRDKECPII